MSTAAERHENGTYTDDAVRFLDKMNRYLRLFHILLYASVSARFAPLATPNGLSGLVQAGAVTKTEREALLASSSAHNAVLTWIIALQQVCCNQCFILSLEIKVEISSRDEILLYSAIELSTTSHACLYVSMLSRSHGKSSCQALLIYSSPIYY